MLSCTRICLPRSSSNAGGRGKDTNGKFDLDGQLNGRNKYKHTTGKAVIFFDQFWKVSREGDLNQTEYKNVNELEAELVPEHDWMAPDPESEPAPTVVDEWLKRWTAVRVFRGLHPSSLPEHVETVVKMLKDAKDMVRWEAVTTLGRLQHQNLEKVADTIMELLATEPKESVREAAIKVIGKMDATDLAKHTKQITQILNDESNFVRLWALIALDKLETDEKCKVEDAIEKSKLEDTYMPVREKAAQILRAHRVKIGKIEAGDE